MKSEQSLDPGQAVAVAIFERSRGPDCAFGVPGKLQARLAVLPEERLQILDVAKAPFVRRDPQISTGGIGVLIGKVYPFLGRHT